MFRNPFSFYGRIRRTEYGITFIIYWVCYVIIRLLMREGYQVALLGLVPMLWFLWAQASKRCHDIGNSGWYQLIPFYFFWLLFQRGDRGENDYGDDPKQDTTITDEDLHLYYQDPFQPPPPTEGGTEGPGGLEI